MSSPLATGLDAALGILPLHGTVQEYAWGAQGTLARLLDRTPSGKPEAEYWLGAHPASPSLVELDGSMLPLDQLIAEAPTQTLGAGRARHSLPFLLKLLAVGRPLSLQVHPSKKQAEAGFDREQDAGVPLDAGHRSYRDRNHKPEVLLPLEPTTAMSGVRQPEEVGAALASVAAAAAGAALPPSLVDLGLGEATPDPAHWAARLAKALRGVFSLSADAGAALQRGLCEALPADTPTGALLHQLAAAFPGDPTVVAALLLNQVTLQPGEALYSGAGTLHAYVSGAGVELMASSDNVLRAGLTPKHIDADELLAIADLRPSPPQTVTPGPAAPGTAAGSIESVYRTPAQEFQLSVVHLAQVPPRGADIPSGDGPEILLLLGDDARVQLRWGDGELELSRGGAVFVPAAVDAYQIAGAGELYRARLPN